MKKVGLLALFLCFSICQATAASIDTMNWCGKYYEQNGTAYLRLARQDLIDGSSTCSPEEYVKKIEKNGQVSVALSFTKKISALGNWRKFENQLVEIRGKLRNGTIANPRFIRNMGI